MNTNLVLFLSYIFDFRITHNFRYVRLSRWANRSKICRSVVSAPTRGTVDKGRALWKRDDCAIIPSVCFLAQQCSDIARVKGGYRDREAREPSESYNRWFEQHAVVSY